MGGRERRKPGSREQWGRGEAGRSSAVWGGGGRQEQWRPEGGGGGATGSSGGRVWTCATHRLDVELPQMSHASSVIGACSRPAAADEGIGGQQAHQAKRNAIAPGGRPRRRHGCRCRDSTGALSSGRSDTWRAAAGSNRNGGAAGWLSRAHAAPACWLLTGARVRRARTRCPGGRLGAWWCKERGAHFGREAPV